MKPKIRMTVTMAMTVILPLQMAYSLVGEILHEVLGFCMLVLFLLHHALNFSWWKQLPRGPYTPVRILMTVVNLLLILVVLLQPLSSIAMSKHLFPWLNSGFSTQAARLMHLALANWGFVLMSIHLGFHLNVLAKRMGLRPLPRGLSYGIRIAFLVFGARAFLLRNLLGYMTLQNQFVFFDFSQPVAHFLIDYVGIMGMFAILGSGLLSLVAKLAKTKKY